MSATVLPAAVLIAIPFFVVVIVAALPTLDNTVVVCYCCLHCQLSITLHF